MIRKEFFAIFFSPFDVVMEPPLIQALGDEMFPQTPRYLVHISLNQRESENRNWNAIGPYEDLLTSMKRRKLKWYRHVTRSSGLAKHSTSRETKRQAVETTGRQHQRVDWP